MKPIFWLCLLTSSSLLAEVGRVNDDVPSLADFRVPKAEFCANPGKYLCDRRYNPYVARYSAAARRYDEIKLAAERDPKVIQYVKDHSNNKSACYQITMSEYYVECKKLVVAAASKDLYSDQIRAKTDDLFEKARTAMVKTLQTEQARIMSPQARRVLDDMILAVNRAKLIYGEEKEYQVPEWNAMHTPGGPLSSITGINSHPNIYVEGYSLLAETNPEALFRVFLHELGHAIGPQNFGGSSKNLKGNPYFNTFDCLRRPEAVGVQRGDADCLESVAKTLGPGNEDVAARLRDAARAVRSEPDVGWVAPKEGQNCQKGQLVEAWPDWIAVRAYSLSRAPRFASAGPAPTRGGDVVLGERPETVRDIMSYISDVCDTFNGELTDYRSSEGARKATKGTHLATIDRVNALYLNSPPINSALGCPTDRLAYLEKENSPKPRRLYCPPTEDKK